MTIISSAALPPPSPTAATNQSNVDPNGQLYTNFMNLLTTQLKNQDPTNPMDNNQLTSQLAQFQTASGVQQLNSTLNKVGTVVLNDMQSANTTNWVGRKVMIGGEANVNAEKADFGVILDSKADNLQVHFKDQDGKTTDYLVKDAKAGATNFNLTELMRSNPTLGLDNAKAPYKVSFTATNQDGSTVGVHALKSAVVQSVSFINGGAQLQLGLDGRVEWRDIVQVMK